MNECEVVYNEGMSVGDAEKRVGMEIEIVPEAAKEAVRSMVRTFLKPDLTREEAEKGMGDYLPVLDDWLKEGGNRDEFLEYDANDTEVDQRMWRGLEKGRSMVFELKFFGGRLKLWVERMKDSVDIWLYDPQNSDDCVRAIKKFDEMCDGLFGEGGGVVAEKDGKEHWNFRLEHGEVIEGEAGLG